MSEDKFSKKLLTKKSVDTSKWYSDVIQLSGLADYGPVRGTMVIKPYGYAIWEFIQKEFDKRFKKLGIKNAYFPLFIPMKLLEKEKEHIEGFSPQLAVVTYGGGKKLDEPLAVRPTSETVIYETYAKWIQSWRDLPVLINQWCNVVRWEKRTYFFLRTLEFLWQEGHTAHATYEEAEKMAKDILDIYTEVYRDVYAIDSLTGLKSESEKFAGADHTYGIELVMPDGKVLQAGTSHHLGDHFSKAFDIKFQDKNGETKYVQQTSWGVSTRSIGGLILSHGDDKGLVLPPKLAPTKVIIIPIFGKRDEEILNYCAKIKDEIEKEDSQYPGEVIIEKDSEKSYGWKVNDAEIKGIPVRITVGGREYDEKTISLACRLDEIGPSICRLSECGKKVEDLLGRIQQIMLAKAKKVLEENTRTASSYEEFKKIMKDKRGFIKAYWCGNAKCEEKIKTETKATTRVLSSEEKGVKGECVSCGKIADRLWYFGQPY